MLWYATLATDLYLDFRYSDAQRLVKKALDMQNLPQPAYIVLLQLQATVFDCRGDVAAALQHYELALKIK